MGEDLILSTKKPFRAQKFEGTICVSGTLTDTTKFDLLADMVESSIFIDMEHVDYASWLGVKNLLEWLLQEVPSYNLKRIPWHIFEMLRIFSMFDGSKVYSIIVPTRNTTSATLFYHEFRVEYIKYIYDKRGIFPETEMGEMLTVPATSICPELFRLNKEKWNFPKGWFMENPRHTQFWLSYLGFVISTVGVGCNLMQSVDIKLQRILANVAKKLNECELALKVIGQPSTKAYAKGAQLLVKEIAEHCLHVGTELSDIKKHFEEIQEKVAGKIIAPDADDSIIDCVVEIQQRMSAIPDINAELESVGEMIGNKVGQIHQIDHIKDEILSFSDPSKDQLGKIRKSFYMIKSSGDGSWESLKLEIEREFARLDKETSTCIVSLQTFDLIRQILEHRHNEGDVIQRYMSDLAAKRIKWEEVEKVLNVYIANSMISEQEKLAFKFFLPAGFEKIAHKKKAAPGEIMLF
ncbi:MAG: hypothetical protein CMP10_07850 [Zetaproteobacteria bacterium]|nr:hypothetical protein [Pseudobdellovibrionaceae bacterium]